MNVDLHLTRDVVSIASDVIDGRVQLSNKAQPVLSYGYPSLTDVLREIGPLPEEALFLGVADDDLPILLNLWDPAPGPLLLAGDSGSGKTAFLQTIARSISLTHVPDEIQYGVITDRLYEWDTFAGTPHCIGIFSKRQDRASDFIRALAIWIRMNLISRQSILLLIDGFDDVDWKHGPIQDLDDIFLNGPTRRIWPIVSVNLENHAVDDHWLKCFHTYVFGYTQNYDRIDTADGHNTRFDTLCKGVDFSLKENSQWIRFRRPEA